MDIWKKSDIFRCVLFIGGNGKKNTWDPITSMLINIHTGKYASLDHWYNNISVKEKEIELKNDYDGRSMILKNVDGLKWL